MNDLFRKITLDQWSGEIRDSVVFCFIVEEQIAERKQKRIIHGIRSSLEIEVLTAECVPQI